MLISFRLDPISSILDEVLRSCQTPATLEAAHALLRSIAMDSPSSQGLEAAQELNDVLKDAGLSGIWNLCSFRSARDQQKRCTVLIDKLIEVSTNPVRFWTLGRD